jgi:hypothetical protein
MNIWGRQGEGDTARDMSRAFVRRVQQFAQSGGRTRRLYLTNQTFWSGWNLAFHLRDPEEIDEVRSNISGVGPVGSRAIEKGQLPGVDSNSQGLETVDGPSMSADVKVAAEVEGVL